MSKEAGNALQSYQRTTQKLLVDRYAPWLKEHTRRVPKDLTPGEAVVMLDAGESADHPLFKDAKVRGRRKKKPAPPKEEKQAN